MLFDIFSEDASNDQIAEWQVLVSFERSKRGHSREGGNPLCLTPCFQQLRKWIPAFAGMTALQERFQAANDTSTEWHCFVLFAGRYRAILQRKNGDPPRGVP